MLLDDHGPVVVVMPPMVMMMADDDRLGIRAIGDCDSERGQRDKGKKELSHDCLRMVVCCDMPIIRTEKNRSAPSKRASCEDDCAVAAQWRANLATAAFRSPESAPFI